MAANNRSTPAAPDGRDWSWLADLGALVGIVMITIGVWKIATPVGLMASGGVLVLGATVAMLPPKARRDTPTSDPCALDERGDRLLLS